MSEALDNSKLAPVARTSHVAPEGHDAPQTQPDEPTKISLVGSVTNPLTLTWLLALTIAVLALMAFLYGRQVAAQAARCRAMQSQLSAMRQNAARILELQQKPQAALARMRSSEEFLGTVEQALVKAGVARDTWKDSIPQPLARVTGTDYQRQTTLLYFDGFNLKQVASFIGELSRLDAALGVSGLNLTARDSGFDIDIAVSYLVYSPEKG